MVGIRTGPSTVVNQRQAASRIRVRNTSGTAIAVSENVVRLVSCTALMSSALPRACSEILAAEAGCGCGNRRHRRSRRRQAVRRARPPQVRLRCGRIAPPPPPLCRQAWRGVKHHPRAVRHQDRLKLQKIFGAAFAGALDRGQPREGGKLLQSLRAFRRLGRTTGAAAGFTTPAGCSAKPARTSMASSNRAARAQVGMRVAPMILTFSLQRRMGAAASTREAGTGSVRPSYNLLAGGFRELAALAIARILVVDPVVRIDPLEVMP